MALKRLANFRLDWPRGCGLPGHVGPSPVGTLGSGVLRAVLPWIPRALIRDARNQLQRPRRAISLGYGSTGMLGSAFLIASPLRERPATAYLAIAARTRRDSNGLHPNLFANSCGIAN